MKFEEALAEMREGKRIRRVGWPLDWYHYLNAINLIVNSHKDMPNIGNNVMANDWQIYEEPEWEPRGGDWIIFPHRTGNVKDDCRDIPEQFKNYGIQRPTQQQAEAARDKMRTFNRLLAYVDEHSDPAEECNAKIFHNGTWVWTTVPLGHQLPDTILMPKRVAEQLCEDLNGGRVVL